MTLISGVAYKVVVRNDENDKMTTYEFTVPANGDYTEITTSAPMSPLPKANWVYSLGEKEAKPFRIVSITRSEEFTRKITALEYVEAVYDDTHIVDLEIIYQNPPVVGGFDAVELIDNVYSLFGSVRLNWVCPGSRGVAIHYSYLSGETRFRFATGNSMKQPQRFTIFRLGFRLPSGLYQKGTQTGMQK